MKSQHARGFTLVELLVVMAIVGILVGMLIPAVLNVRASARRTSCLNNIKNIGLAIQNFETAHGYVPPAARFGEGTAWQAFILPHIEQEQMYEAIEIVDPSQNFEWAVEGEATLQKKINMFRCPTEPAPLRIFSNGYGERAICSYLACCSGTIPSSISNFRSTYLELKVGDENDVSAISLVRELRSGVMPPTQVEFELNSGVTYPEFKTKVKFSDVLDGTSNTVMVGEAIFDTTRHYQSGTSGPSVSVGADHWYIGSGSMDITSSYAGTNPVLDFPEFMATTAVPFNYYHQNKSKLNYDGLNGSSAVVLRLRDHLAFSFNSWHTGNGVNFVLADGSSRYVVAEIDEDVRLNLGNIADRQKIAAGDF